MPIDSVTTSPTTTLQPKTDAGSLGSDMNTFMLLLTTQLQNQNPLEPMDTDKFTQQLVQYSSVEQSIKMNDKLADLVSLMETSEANAAIQYIGNDVVADSSSFYLPVSGDTHFAYSLPEGAADVVLTVKDEFGRTMATIKGENEAGQNILSWNGKDAAGNRMPEGVYELGAIARNSDSKAIPVDLTLSGKVNGVERTSSGLVLSIDNVLTQLQQVRKVQTS